MVHIPVACVQPPTLRKKEGVGGCTQTRYVPAICSSSRGTQRQFSENICSEDDLRSRILGTFVAVKFLA